MALGEEEVKSRHLRFGQPEKVAQGAVSLGSQITPQG
jgi:hypothetical protein